MDPNYREKVMAEHDKERALLNSTNMMKLVWDDVLEELAWERAITCEFDHGNNILNGVQVGQNLARFPHGSDPVSHVLTWVAEKRYFDFNTRICPNMTDCGHYNQLVWAQASRIGCAHHHCPNLQGDYMVCNYLKFGNYLNTPAFKVDGAPCSGCNFKGGTACIKKQCLDCEKNQPPEGTECRPYSAKDLKPCEDLYHLCDKILQNICGHQVYERWSRKYCQKTCGFCP